jgi:hypothetical protein
MIATCDMVALPPDTVARVLDAHAAASPAHFKGIRAKWALPFSENFASNMELLEQRGLLYELGAAFDQLEEAIEVASAFPKIKMVLNHWYDLFVYNVCACVRVCVCVCALSPAPSCRSSAVSFHNFQHEQPPSSSTPHQHLHP